MAVGYTAGMSAAIGEAVKLGSESAAGEAVHEWLKHHYPFGEAGVSATGAGAGEAAPAPAPAPVAPEMHQPAAGYHTNVAELRQMDVALEPKIPSVDIQATPGHGYEWMLKRMWENLHENHAILPKGIDPHSDLGELLKIQPGDKAGIDKLVHDMALKHSFFNQAGETSVQIDPSAHMTIGAGGQLHLADAVHGDMVRAVENMHTTPAYQPEAPTTSAEVLEQQRQEILDRLANQTNAGHTVAEQAPSITAETTEPLTQPPSPVVERGIITNQFDLSIPIAEPHIYASPDGERLYVYGGSLKEQMNKVLAFLIAHQDKIVYTPDAEGAHRIPWHFINGEIEPAGPLEKSSGFLGFGRAFIKEPPGPNDLAKIIE